MRLTLGEAQKLSLDNNKSLSLARLNVEEKGHAAAAARKDYFPKVIGSDTYFHFNDDLGSVVTFQRGRLGILPPGSRIINATVINQDSNLAAIMVAQPITKLIAVNAAVQLAPPPIMSTSFAPALPRESNQRFFPSTFTPS